MRRGTNYLLAIVFLVANAAFGSNPVVLPDWVQQSIDQPKGTYPDETHAVVLRNDTVISVISAGEYVEHQRRVVRILRPEGRNEGTFAVHTKGGDRITYLHAWSVDPGGHKYEVKQSEFGQSNYSEDELYNDVRRFVAKMPGLETGTVVALESDVHYHNFSSDLTWWPQEDIPVKSATFLLELPSGWEYSSAWANTGGTKCEPQGTNRCKWSLSDIAGIEEEPLRLSQVSLAQRLDIAFYGQGVSNVVGSWGAIGTWYKGLSDPRRTSTPEIAEKTRQITAGRTSFDSQVRAIANFLQRDVRYVAIAIGIGGVQPHYANDIFRHKYGDCKDKATLMATMLKELGYSSQLVLVDTDREFVKPSVPSTMFDHAIIAIELPADIPDNAYPSTVKTKSGKRYVIFDPTNEYTPFGLIPAYEQNSYVLIASDPGELVRLPLFQPELSVNESAGKFVLGDDKVLSGEMVQSFKGHAASEMRLILSQFDGTDRSRLMELVANSSLKAASVESPQFENLKDTEKELTIKYKVKMNGYAQNAGGLLIVRPRVFGDKALNLPKKARNYSIELRNGPRHDRDVFEITLPSGYVLDELPENTHVDFSFASYDSKFESKGNVIRYTRDYIVKEPLIELSKMDEVKRLENAIAVDQMATAVLKKAP